jgi:DNA polymerase III epsilon subunit-like protein
MIVVDVETTGTNPQQHSLVSIGAIDLYHPTERFYVECHIWDGAKVESEALEVNGFTREEIEDHGKSAEAEAVKAFFDWLSTRESKLIAAHNPLFDLGFLEAAAYRAHLDFNLARRSVDLHSVAFAHMLARGVTPPTKNGKSDLNADRVMEYVGIPAEPRPHKAINGAVWEAEALSRLIFSQNLLEDFKNHPIPWKR